MGHHLVTQDQLYIILLPPAQDEASLALLWACPSPKEPTYHQTLCFFLGFQQIYEGIETVCNQQNYI